MSEHPIVVFTDGAAKRNPGPGGWGVVIVTPDGHVTELGGGAPLTTNNKMELSGAIAALAHLERAEGRLAIYTDSTYVIQGVTEWVHNWRRRDWKTATGGEVLNRELWEELSGSDGGAAAALDRLALRAWALGHPRQRARRRDCRRLCRDVAACRSTRGHSSATTSPILDIPDDTSVPKRSASSSAGGGRAAKGPAFSYLSVVDGQPMRHATWAECERRVKGRSGARFKKAMNVDDQAAVLRAWGFQPGDV